MTGLFFQIGGFSGVNAAVGSALRAEMTDVRWVDVDVERDVVGGDRVLWAGATFEAVLRYWRPILGSRIPPRDFFPRLPLVLRAVRVASARAVATERAAFVFQTQSLFDAGCDGVPQFVYTDHTYLANQRYPEPKAALAVPEAWLEMERELYRRAACTFTTSQFAATSVIEDYGVDPARVECVFSGRNILPAGESNFAEARSGRVILFMGVDWERKGGPELVEIFKEVRRAVADAELWIVGDAPVADGDGIKNFGRVPAGEARELYVAADVFCLPSRMDPSASVLAEAAGFGMPVVATPVGGNLERVVDGETGFLCGVDEMAERLVRLLTDADLRQAMGDAGRRRAEEEFSWQAVAAKMARRIREESAK